MVLLCSIIFIIPSGCLSFLQFNGNFHVQGMPFREGAIKSNMMHVLDTREGTAEEVFENSLFKQQNEILEDNKNGDFFFLDLLNLFFEDV